MTQPRPTAAELIAAVREFLAAEAMAELDGRKRFHAKVAVNVLDTVERELRDGPVAGSAERARLIDLLGETAVGGDTEPEAAQGTEGFGAPAEAASTDDLARRLAAGIRSGQIDIDDPRLIDHLRRTAAADVAIANPKWVG